jgi:hypothetical protein
MRWIQQSRIHLGMINFRIAYSHSSFQFEQLLLLVPVQKRYHIRFFFRSVSVVSNLSSLTCSKFTIRFNEYLEPASYYDFADAALVMIDAADLPADQEHVSVKDFCQYLEAKGYSRDRHFTEPFIAVSLIAPHSSSRPSRPPFPRFQCALGSSEFLRVHVQSKFG